MRKTIILLAIGVALVPAMGQTIPHHFTARSAALADSVNANFNYMITQIRALRAQDSIESAQRVVQDSLNNPKGIIVASLVAPDFNGWMPNTNHAWAVCDGDPSKKSLVTGIGLPGDSIPDLRGVFLRSLDFISSGRAATGLDPITDRVAGSYESDAYGSHNHNLVNTGGDCCYSTGVMIGNNGPNDMNGGASGSVVGQTIYSGVSETRSKNVAVYYYIKVK